MFCPECEREFLIGDAEIATCAGVKCPYPGCPATVSYTSLKNWAIKKDQEIEQAKKELATIQHEIEKEETDLKKLRAEWFIKHVQCAEAGEVFNTVTEEIGLMRESTSLLNEEIGIYKNRNDKLHDQVTRKLIELNDIGISLKEKGKRLEDASEKSLEYASQHKEAEISLNELNKQLVERNYELELVQKELNKKNQELLRVDQKLKEMKALSEN